LAYLPSTWAWSVVGHGASFGICFHRAHPPAGEAKLPLAVFGEETPAYWLVSVGAPSRIARGARVPIWTAETRWAAVSSLFALGGMGLGSAQQAVGQINRLAKAKATNPARLT
jgi:hypothetical protein